MFGLVYLSIGEMHKLRKKLERDETMNLNYVSSYDVIGKDKKTLPELKANLQQAVAFNQSPRSFLLNKDTVSFKELQSGGPVRQSNIAFAGLKNLKDSAQAYLDNFDLYKTTTDLHNKILYSYGDPSSMAQALADTSKKTGQTKDQIFDEVKENMFNAFDRLKASPVLVLEDVKLDDSTVLDKKVYEQVKNIYHDVLDRSELFERVVFDSKERKLKENVSEDFIKDKSEDFKHIINDIIPEILESKKIIVQDPANLKRIITDPVIQSLIMDKLDEEAPQEKLHNPFKMAPTCGHDHSHNICNHDHDHSEHDHIDEKHDHKAEGHDHTKPDHDHDHHDHDHHEHQHTPEEKLDFAVLMAERIHDKFNINMLSKVPEHFYDPINKDKNAKHTPDDYYDSKNLATRQVPRNFYEAQFLKKVAKDIKGFDENNTIIVTPKTAANDIIEKIKAMNKEYLFLEDWLYKYCLGDKKAKESIIQKLESTMPAESRHEIREIAKDIDKYQENFIKVYDINKPENTAKLTDSIKDFSKISCMSEISRGYFLGVGEDATDMVKTLFGLALFIHGAEHLAEATGVDFIINLSNTANSVSDDVLDACKNYLKWKKELGDDVAKKKLHETISHSLTISLPTLMFKLSPDASAAEHLAFRNLSSGSTYSILISNFTEYYNKLEELIDKGLKEIPEDIKDNPDKVAKWKLTEAWNGYAGHSLNVGTFVGLAASQPFAVAAGPMMKFLLPVGGRAIVVALAGTFECWTSNIYLLLDSGRWNKFTNKLKEKFVKDKKAEMTPEQYLDNRKVLTSSIIQGPVGQAAFMTGIKVKELCPSWLSGGVKKAYMLVYNVVEKTLGKAISGVCQKVLDKKYNRMSEEEREKIEGSKCGHNHG